MVNSIQSRGRFLLCSDKYFITLPKSKTDNGGRKKEDKKEQLLPFLLLHVRRRKILSRFPQTVDVDETIVLFCFSLLLFTIIGRMRNHPSG